MASALSTLLEMIESPDSVSDDFGGAELPESMRAITLRHNEEEMFVGMNSSDKDPRQSLHYDELPLPPLGIGQVIVAVMASSLNYNTIWSSIFEPLSSFSFLSRYALMREQNRVHAQLWHIIGSDASGVIVRIGPGVNRWKPGDRVNICPCVMDMTSPSGYRDSMLDPHLQAWGFETNYGGLAHFTVVNSSQLMPKAEHLSWEESASMALVSGTAYRMLVSANGAAMKQGDNVLLWGAAGGLGALGIQYVLNGGGTPIGVVSGEKKAELLRQMGCEAVIDREKLNGGLLKEDGSPNMRQLLKLRKWINHYLGDDELNIVYEHSGRETFAASVFLAARGGKIVTCGSTSGYEHIYDNRYLWMNLKTIIGSHGANYHEAWEANRLACKGDILPVLSDVYTLEETPHAASLMHRNLHTGKLGILSLAPREGLGIRNHELREKIGAARINHFRQRHGAATIPEEKWAV